MCQQSQPVAHSSPVIAALLAGGASRRMGRDKASLLLGNRPLASWAAAALATTTEHRVQIGGRAIEALGWTVLEDRRPDSGPGAGLETALLHFPGAVALVCAVDTPFVPATLLEHARRQLTDGYDAAVPYLAGRWQPLAAAYSPRILPALSDWLDGGNKDLQRLLDGCRVARIDEAQLREFGDPEALLFNVNTPAQFARAQELASGAELR